MSFFQRIASFLETTLATTKPTTADDFAALARSLRETDLPEAQAALEKIEQQFDAEYFQLAGNELALKRAEKKRDEARAEVARIQEALRRADNQAMRLVMLSQRDALLKKAQETDAILIERIEVAKRIDGHITAMAQDFVKLVTLNGSVLEKAPQRLRHLPAMFMRNLLQSLIEQKLYGFSDGDWKGFSGLETPFTIRKLRSLEKRAQEERTLVMSEQPQPDPPPAA